jgi:hypothetical protein
MTVMETETSTETFTVRAFAAIEVAESAADLIDRILSAIEEDPRALAPVVDYDYDKQQVSALFQIEVESSAFAFRRAQAATHDAISLFDAAIARCGIDAVLGGLSIVEGDDPDLLP